MIYNHDIKNLQKNFSPLNSRNWKKNRPLSEYEDQENNINDLKKYESEIDAKIREFKEYEEIGHIRIFKIDSNKK